MSTARLARVAGAFALQGGTTLGGSLFAILSARALGPNDRGLVVLALVTVQMAAQFSTLGVNQSARTAAAREGLAVAWASWRPRRLLIASVSGVTGLLAGTAVFQPHNQSGLTFAVAIGLATLFASADIVLRDALHGDARHGRAQGADVLMWCTALGALGILALGGLLTALSVTGALLAGYVGQWIALNWSMPSSDGVDVAPYSVRLTTFFSSAGQYALMRIDKLLVGVVVSAGAVGLYSAAATLAEIAWVPCLLLAQMGARAAARRDWILLQRIRIVALGCSLGWIVVCVPLGERIIVLLFGSGFEAAHEYVFPRAISAALYGLAYIELAVLVSVGQQRTASMVSWAGVGLTAGAVCLAPVIGLTGALWVAAVVACIVTTAAMGFSRLEKPTAVGVAEPEPLQR